MKDEIQHLDEVTAIAPWYGEHGSTTRIFTCGHAEQQVSLSAKTVMMRLAARYGKTLPLLRRQAKGERAKRTRALPISPGIVLMPWKVRRPRVQGDACMGFLNITYPFDLETDGNGLLLRLIGQERLPILWSKETFLRHKAEALVSFFSEHTRVQRDINRCQSFYLDLLHRLH